MKKRYIALLLLTLSAGLYSMDMFDDLGNFDPTSLQERKFCTIICAIKNKNKAKLQKLQKKQQLSLLEEYNPTTGQTVLQFIRNNFLQLGVGDPNAYINIIRPPIQA